MKEAKPETEGYIPSGKKGDYNYYGGFNDGIEEGAKQEKERILKIINKWFKSFDTEERYGYLLKEDVEELKKEIEK